MVHFLQTRLRSPPAHHHYYPVLDTRPTAPDVPPGSQFPPTTRANSPASVRTTYHSPVGLRQALERKYIISHQMHLSIRGTKCVISNSLPPGIEHPSGLDFIRFHSWFTSGLCVRALVSPATRVVLCLFAPHLIPFRFYMPLRHHYPPLLYTSECSAASNTITPIIECYTELLVSQPP